MKRLNKWWIKERHNPQTGTYYVAMGLLSSRKGKAHENSLYGDNKMHCYLDEAEYNAKLKELRDNGESVQ